MPEFILYPDPRLSQPATATGAIDDALRATGKRLFYAAKAAKAHGLAAVHIGEVAPIVVVGGGPDEYRLLFNPKVTAVSDGHEIGEEGSVSLPGVRANLDRPLWAEIAYQTDTGAAATERFNGFGARVVLHEIDQMNGIFFLDRLSRLKRDMALKKAKKRGG